MSISRHRLDIPQIRVVIDYFMMLYLYETWETSIYYNIFLGLWKEK